MADPIREPGQGDPDRIKVGLLVPYRLIHSRRFMIAMYAITCLTIIAITNKLDTAMAIATVASALAASNAFQKKDNPNAHEPKD